MTFNRRDMLRQSLSALLAQSRPLDEILLVDNASSDGTGAMVAEEFPRVHLVKLAENTGAAGGFAAALEAAEARGHDWVWVFNDDDIPEPPALATMLDATAQLPPRTGMVACGRVDAGGQPHNLGAHWRGRIVPVPPTDPATPPFSLDVVSFCGTLVSTDLIRHIGLPKREFFMMMEELEYCRRTRDAGWAIMMLPQPLVTSLTAGSDGSAPPWRGYYQTRNHLTMALERRSLPELAWWLSRTLRFCAGALRSGDQPAERIRLRLLGGWHAARGVGGRTIAPASMAHGGPGPDDA